MVETKTAKRKMAAKTASRAANEILAASNKAAKDAKDASKKAASPAPAKAASPALASRTTRSRKTSKPAGASAAKATGAKGAGKAPAKGEKGSNSAEADPAERDPFEEDADGDDSLDGDDEDEGGEQRLVIKLDKKQEKKLAAGLKTIQGPAAAGPTGASSVVYLGRVPFGFFEKQMRDYFTQFGEVKRLRLSRNKKTGKSKHYAFIEFVHPEVAAIVAETHDNMLICDRMVKCNLVPLDKIHETMWNGADMEFKAFPWKKMAKADSGRKRTVQEEDKRVQGLVSRENKKRSKLQALGIDYDFGGFQDLVDRSKPKKTKFDD